MANFSSKVKLCCNFQLLATMTLLFVTHGGKNCVLVSLSIDSLMGAIPEALYLLMTKGGKCSVINGIDFHVHNMI